MQDEDLKLLQRPDGLSPERAVAAALRFEEKAILLATNDAVRRRLAPIRGIPTKTGGLKDPNADLAEIFETIEEGPRKLWGSFARWASGKDDPDFRR